MELRLGENYNNDDDDTMDADFLTNKFVATQSDRGLFWDIVTIL
jgi:hypothetical protein